jgi:hypothetical protein
MPDLTTLAQVRQMLSFDPSVTDDDPLIADVLIPAASTLIESYCRTAFGTITGQTLVMDAAKPYLYGDTLFFRDQYVLTVDSFVTDTVTLTAADYDLLPYNSPRKTAARLRRGKTWNYSDPRGAFRITGSVGYGSIPPDVRLAATRLAAWLYQTRDNEGAVVVAGDTTTIPAEAPPLVFKILNQGRYVRDMVYV